MGAAGLSVNRVNMIIWTTAPLVVGQRYQHDVIGHDGDVYNIPFIVLRVATRAEWLEYTEDAEMKESWLKARGVVVDSYYEVSTD